MRTPPQLTLPGLVVLIAIAVALTYFEKGNNTGNAPSVQRDAPASTQPANASRNDEAPGNFDYYALVLSWSPTHCESPEGQDDAAQCEPRHGRPYAFVLHGLWPQYERGYPEDCPGRSRYVPQPVIDRMMDIMPSKGLIIHEYRKHGTCSGLGPDDYFDAARRMYSGVTIPERFRSPTQMQTLDPSEVVDEFVRANRNLRPDMIAVACRGPGSRLREVRICFSKTGDAISCGANERQGKLCRSSQMSVPPVR